jgi:hypothetical protein
VRIPLARPSARNISPQWKPILAYLCEKQQSPEIRQNGFIADIQYLISETHAVGRAATEARQQQNCTVEPYPRRLLMKKTPVERKIRYRRNEHDTYQCVANYGHRNPAQDQRSGKRNAARSADPGLPQIYVSQDSTYNRHKCHQVHPHCRLTQSLILGVADGDIQQQQHSKGPHSLSNLRPCLLPNRSLGRCRLTDDGDGRWNGRDKLFDGWLRLSNSTVFRLYVLRYRRRAHQNVLSLGYPFSKPNEPLAASRTVVWVSADWTQVSLPPSPMHADHSARVSAYWASPHEIISQETYSSRYCCFKNPS